MTLSASLTNIDKKLMRRTSLIFLCITLFSGLFSAVYEHFSHDVYSNFMVYLFMFPFFGGVVPYAILGLTPRTRYPSKAALRLYNSGIATLAVGSCVKGVLDIYGTTSLYMPIYWAAGIVLTAIGLAVYIIGYGSKRKADV